MRVNVYAEEMTGVVTIIEKEIGGVAYVGVRFHLYLPVTVRDSKVGGGDQVQGPFIHRDGDDDSSAVTFWGKKTLKDTLKSALRLLETHAPAATTNNDFNTTYDANARRRGQYES